MFGLSRKTDYALLVVTALARRPEGFVSMRALAAAYHLPYRFTAQIVSDLTHAGILEAREGVKGGYRFSRVPASVTVADILRATEKRSGLVSCLDPSAHRSCPQKAWCNARAGVRVLERELFAVLRKTTIADFLRSSAPSSSSLSPHVAHS